MGGWKGKRKGTRGEGDKGTRGDGKMTYLAIPFGPIPFGPIPNTLLIIFINQCLQ